MDDGSRIRAARWVIGLGRLYGAVLGFAAAWSLVGVLFTGSAVALVLPLLLAGCALAWGALVRAFTAHRRGAWRVLLGVATVGVLWPVIGWLGTGSPGAGGVLSCAVHVVLLGLLLHPDSREWVEADGALRCPADADAP